MRKFRSKEEILSLPTYPASEMMVGLKRYQPTDRHDITEAFDENGQGWCVLIKDNVYYRGRTYRKPMQDED